jgi:hypothetical protein
MGHQQTSNQEVEIGWKRRPRLRRPRPTKQQRRSAAAHETVPAIGVPGWWTNKSSEPMQYMRQHSTATREATTETGRFLCTDVRDHVEVEIGWKQPRLRRPRPTKQQRRSAAAHETLPAVAVPGWWTNKSSEAKIGPYEKNKFGVWHRMPGRVMGCAVEVNTFILSIWSMIWREKVSLANNRFFKGVSATAVVFYRL